MKGKVTKTRYQQSSGHSYLPHCQFQWPLGHHLLLHGHKRLHKQPQWALTLWYLVSRSSSTQDLMVTNGFTYGFYVKLSCLTTDSKMSYLASWSPTASLAASVAILALLIWLCCQKTAEKLSKDGLGQY